MTQLAVHVQGYGDAVALKLARLAEGDKEHTLDNLYLAMASDPLLRSAIEQAGIRHLASGALSHYRELARTGGNYMAAHPG